MFMTKAATASPAVVGIVVAVPPFLVAGTGGAVAAAGGLPALGAAVLAGAAVGLVAGFSTSGSV
jgi:hypothetical protein